MLALVNILRRAGAVSENEGLVENEEISSKSNPLVSNLFYRATI